MGCHHHRLSNPNIMEQVNLYITTIFLFKQDSLAQGNLSGVKRK